MKLKVPARRSNSWPGSLVVLLKVMFVIMIKMLKMMMMMI